MCVVHPRKVTRIPKSRWALEKVTGPFKHGAILGGIHVGFLGCNFPGQVEAPVEMSSFSVVLPCAFEGEFAEKTVWAVWENTAPWFSKNILGRGILDRKVNFERRKASFYWKEIFLKIP